MNELQLQQQIDETIDPEVMPNYFTRPESTSRHIFEVEKSPSNAFNKDTARANLEPPELNTVKTNIGLIAHISYTEEFMLDAAKTDEQQNEIQKQMLRLTNLFRDEQSGTVVPSRSKRGYSILMAKTDRNVQMQDMTDFSRQQQQDFNPNENKQGIGEKIRGAIPFLKKKEMNDNGQ